MSFLLQMNIARNAALGDKTLHRFQGRKEGGGIEGRGGKKTDEGMRLIADA